MRISVQHLSTILDERAVDVLFQGHAVLNQDWLECKDSMAEFVTHRLALLETQIRLLEAEDGLQVRIAVPAHNLYVETFIPHVLDEEHAIHEAVRQLRFSGKRYAADQLEAILPELLWYLDAKRYLDARRRLRNIQETVDTLEMRLNPVPSS